MKTAIDFDGVLSHTMKSWVSKYNKKSPQKITIRDIDKWAFYEKFDMDLNEAFEIFDDTWSDYSKLEPMEHELNQKTKMLNNLGGLDVVTSVTEKHKKSLILWLSKHGITFDKIIFSNSKEELDYDYFIDDSPLNAQKFTDNKKNCLLYNQPWNRNVVDNIYITRVYSLYHAIDIIRGY